MNPKVDFYFNKAGKWQAEMNKLRTVVLNSITIGHQLTEDLKWGCPCYAYKKSNIVLIHTFKEYCALLFFKGALLNDPNGILIQQTENVQSARQVRFTNLPQIVEMEPILKAYISQAVDVEKAGLKISLKKTTEFNVPEEFQRQLDENAALKTAFATLTPGRQRGYLFYFSQPKQSKTREARIEKYIPKILNGKGVDD